MQTQVQNLFTFKCFRALSPKLEGISCVPSLFLTDFMNESRQVLKIFSTHGSGLGISDALLKDH